MKKITLAVSVLLVQHFLAAQSTDSVSAVSANPPAVQDTAQVDNVFDLNLEDLMDVKVVSASKKSESAFDAPLSIGSVTREEIKRAGALSIMEALRLVPGVIVRENSNGNYDVFIRGFENLPPSSSLSSAGNSISLVMINNRPVYNYFNGGTFWETLPIDLNDVETIEVVRGPSSALYGPNAANGVVNIITRKTQKEGLYTVANAQVGSQRTNIANASVGYAKGKLDFIVSGNYQNRKRSEEDYYSWIADKKVPMDSVVTSYPANTPLMDVNGKPNLNDRYPNPSQSQNKFGYNGFFNYNASKNASLGLNLGGQQSSAQVAFIDNLATPLSLRTSTTNYADLRGKLYGLNAQVSYQQGIQDASKGYNGYKYNFNTVDALTEYDFNIYRFSLKPGISYRSAVYDDSKYAEVTNQEGFINGEKVLTNYAGSFRAEYDDKKVIKLIAAIRGDKYNNPSAIYTSYQFAANFKINEKNLIRSVYSKAFRGPTMYDIYSSQSLLIVDGPTQVAPGVFMPLKAYAVLKGNPDLALQKIEMFELGYRLKATDYLHFDLDAFTQTSSNYALLVNASEASTLTPTGIKAVYTQNIQNISMKAQQTGVTLGVNFVYTKFQFKPFITLQQTFLTDVPKGRDSATVNLLTQYDGTNSSTPAFYGGWYLNYQATNKINLNVSGYYYGASKYSNIYHQLAAPTAANPTPGVVNISDKVMVNARFSYKFFNKLDVFLNARNAFNAEAQEFANTDITQGIYMVGASFEY